MSQQLNSPALRAEVQARLGLELDLDVVTLDGCNYQALRPRDLERGHGFFVAVAQTPKQILASLHFEPYAGRLFRLMADADGVRKSAMEALVSNAPQAGLSAYCVSEEAHTTDQTPGASSWRSLEVEVSARIARKHDTTSLQRLAADVASYAFAIPLCLVQIEEVDLTPIAATGQMEGMLSKVVVNKYERSPANRAACLAYHGTRCKGCGFDFGTAYGEIGCGFIEVHHSVPVSSMGEDYIVDPINELIPLCSNCHSMIHRRSPPLLLEELIAIISTSIKQHH
ncbi:HNH endonuclease [Stenotrophomonas maltophilia]|uniref:HNH endonuclease n=1 Tax=Stenotrophomonas maltophilia TaxID=40324 RepID=UPI0034DB6918